MHFKTNILTQFNICCLSTHTTRLYTVAPTPYCYVEDYLYDELALNGLNNQNYTMCELVRQSSRSRVCLLELKTTDTFLTFK